MSISELSVKRKIAMCAFLFMLIFLGIKMYRSISIDSMPKFDVPYVVITTIYPGASPEDTGEIEVAAHTRKARRTHEELFGSLPVEEVTEDLPEAEKVNANGVPRVRGT
jgi:HAE1 family hydrophobic/amphiphilic exporter-1